MPRTRIYGTETSVFPFPEGQSSHAALLPAWALSLGSYRQAWAVGVPQRTWRGVEMSVSNYGGKVLESRARSFSSPFGFERWSMPCRLGSHDALLLKWHLLPLSCLFWLSGSCHVRRAAPSLCLLPSPLSSSTTPPPPVPFHSQWRFRGSTLKAGASAGAGAAWPLGEGVG